MILMQTDKCCLILCMIVAYTLTCSFYMIKNVIFILLLFCMLLILYKLFDGMGKKFFGL